MAGRTKVDILLRAVRDGCTNTCPGDSYEKPSCPPTVQHQHHSLPENQRETVLFFFNGNVTS